jgi:signal transduction histidine kinase
MKIVVVLVLALMIQRETFVHAAIIPSSSKVTVSSEQRNIDHLNDIAFSIYLQAPDSARVIAEKALLLAEQSKYKEGIGRSFLNIGHVYWSQSYYPIALLYLNKALINLPRNKPLLIADCYEITGRTYAELGNYSAAFNCFDKAEQLAGGDPGRLAEIHTEISYAFFRLKKYDRAIEETNRALLLNKITRDKNNEAILYGRLGSIYLKKGDYKAALAYADTTCIMSLAIHNNRLRAITYRDYALVYNKLHDFDKAIVYAEKSAALADSIGVVDALSSAYRSMISSYEQKNDLKQALAYQKKYISIQDSLNQFNKAKNTELIQAYFELNTRLSNIESFERNAQEIRAKVSNQRLIIISLILSLIVVIGILSVTYYYYTQKKQLNDQLRAKHEALLGHKQLIEAQTANLQTISTIKDKLLAVIGHDLRTPLANLRNIVELFEADYIPADEVHWLMKDINPLVKGAELTLSNLMDWAGSHIKGRSIHSSRLDIYLLGVEMEQTFNHALQRKNIEFVNQACAGLSVLADENHIKVVLRNLISNAIKFTDTKGCIKLNSIHKENKVIISIQDNGKGMSTEEVGMLFYLQTHFSQPGTLGESGTGIGLLLCKELVELNGGKLWISSKPGKGSTFFFSLPLNTEYA